MGNNKVHTKGQLQGKKGNGTKALHPQSRRVKQTARVDLRTKKLGEVRAFTPSATRKAFENTYLHNDRREGSVSG